MSLKHNLKNTILSTYTDELSVSVDLEPAALSLKFSEQVRDIAVAPLPERGDVGTVFAE